jgi:hypothetical protein
MLVLFAFVVDGVYKAKATEPEVTAAWFRSLIPVIYLQCPILNMPIILVFESAKYHSFEFAKYEKAKSHGKSLLLFILGVTSWR